MGKLQVGVVFGGRSVEHDVSIVTAHQVMEKLVPSHDVVPIYVTREGRWLTSPQLNDLAVYRHRRWDAVAEEAFIPPIAGYRGLLAPGGRLRGARRIPLDVAVPAIHGTFGEDGTLQGLLELADIPYTGSGVVGSAVGMDKIAMKAVFKAAGLPIPAHLVVPSSTVVSDPHTVVREVETRLGYPVFVKPSRLGSSVGIAKARDEGSLLEALEIARRYDDRLLVEQSMDGCIEINCSILGGEGRAVRASVCEQPVAWEEFLSFSDKYLRSAKQAPRAEGDGMAGQDRRIPAPISSELTAKVQDAALAAFAAVGASGVARVDSFVREETGEVWVNEINTVPGSFSFYLWEPSGVSFEELMAALIDMAFVRQQRRSELLFSFESGMLDKARGAKTGG